MQLTIFKLKTRDIKILFICISFRYRKSIKSPSNFSLLSTRIAVVQLTKKESYALQMHSKCIPHDIFCTITSRFLYLLEQFSNQECNSDFEKVFAFVKLPLNNVIDGLMNKVVNLHKYVFLVFSFLYFKILEFILCIT